MQQCPNCGHQNRPGVVFCDNCGASLIGKLPLDTKSLGSSSEEEKAQLGVEASVLTDVKVQGAAEFKEGSSLRLEIEGSPEPILFKPKPETIFGRRDPATGAMPDIDLTPFAGYRMGVSRRHAAIRQAEDKSLDLWDLGSSNGTFLNSQRLSAHRPYRLHDGDEVRLGQMVLRVFYDTPEPTKPDTEPKDTQPLTPESLAGPPSPPPQAPPPAPLSKQDAPVTTPVDTSSTDKPDKSEPEVPEQSTAVPEKQPKPGEVPPPPNEEKRD